jgi:ABC-type lipoprotein release transport system permease subunit
MIRRRDQLRLSLQKLRLRMKRSVFSVITIALGVLVVITADSLIEGVRRALTTTAMEEELHPDEISISAQSNPIIEVAEQMKAASDPGFVKPRKRFTFPTHKALEEWRTWPEIEAADERLEVYSVSVDEFNALPAAVFRVRGVPEALLRRYAGDEAMDAASASNAIPMVIGEKICRLEYDNATQSVVILPLAKARRWVGTMVTIRLGDNYASLNRYERSYEDNHYVVRPLTAESLATRREQIDLGYQFRYDPILHGLMLRLNGCVVGIYSGNEILVPIGIARQMDAWLKARDNVAALGQTEDASEPVFTSLGRRTAQTNEFAEGSVLVASGADVEAVARRINDLGYNAVTRKQLFEAQAMMFETGLRVVRRVAYALAGVILFLAMGLLWNTISRIVSDSRPDIGLFRALGATKRDVQRLFLTEASLLGLMGAATGILAGWGLAGSISHLVIRYVRRSLVSTDELLTVPDSIFTFHIGFAALILLAALALSALAGWRPASRAANTDPVKALKRE